MIDVMNELYILDGYVTAGYFVGPRLFTLESIIEETVTLQSPVSISLSLSSVVSTSVTLSSPIYPED